MKFTRRPESFRPATLRAAIGLGLVLASACATSRAGDPAPDFNREVRPILARNCFGCHGQDDASRKAGLRLDRRDDALATLKSEAVAIVPGSPDESALLARVEDPDESLRMPPRKSADRLSPAETRLLRRWIAAGAPYVEHWAWTAPKPRPLPAVKLASWPRNGLDRWILARLESEGLSPSPEADSATLLRRASLDLRGLPPTPAEIAAFDADHAPGAYERAVDRLLDDPAYGERLARVWLDLARYADSAGYGSDPLRTIWRYRDWVIDAFNANVPFDRFTVDQIAGDLLPDATPAQKVATAFHRNTMTNTEGGTDDEEFRVAAIKDRVDTTAQVWLGLTLGCAKCHTHKFDPITHDDYYRVFAIFNQTADADRPDESPVLATPSPDDAAHLARAEANVALLKALASAPTTGWLAHLARAGSAALPLQQALKTLDATKKDIPTVPVMAELPPEKARTTHLLEKGNFLTPGKLLTPGLPAAFPPLPPGEKPNRLGLARWLVDPANPLTSRVAVNRYWALLFGAGLVETEEDFGTQGEPPSHPELLDWLALRYIDLRWDTRALLREIVTSATYRQSSHVTPALLAADPRNRLLSRGARFRLDAETVRDQALALSGLLSRKMHGPSVFPPQPGGLWQAAFNGQRTWSTSAGEDRHRRGLYTFWRRTIPYPSMAAFDAPSREICSVRRSRTNTPLQALVTLNDPVYIEAAQALARRVIAEGGEGTDSKIRYALKLCLGRPPADAQVAALSALYQSEHAHYARDESAARTLATDPLGPLPPGASPAEYAAWTTLANVLLNLDGVLTRG